MKNEDKSIREEDDIRLASEGNEQAFARLVQAYESLVYNVAFHALGSTEDAFDLSQEIFLKVYRSLPSFRGECKFSTWIYRVTVNTVRDAIRTKSRRPKTLSLSHAAEDEPDAVPDLPDPSPDADPESVLQKREQAKRVRSAIRQLSDDHREIIVLRDLEGYSYEEIASMLSLDIGTVKSRLNRARGALKNLLSDLQPGRNKKPPSVVLSDRKSKPSVKALSEEEPSSSWEKKGKEEP